MSKTTPASLAFATYELLGLSSIGPSRHELRDSGLAALRSHAPGLLAATVVIAFTLVCGWREALKRLGARDPAIVAGMAALPVFIVVLSGFVMRWRVLGRHLFATIPVINLLMALGLVQLWNPSAGRLRGASRLAAAACLATLAISALWMRCAERHTNDVYRLAASIAKDALARGLRVW